MKPASINIGSIYNLHNSTIGSNEDASMVHRIAVTLSATLSLLGTSVIIGTFFAWRDFRSTSRRILVYISVADFLIAGSYLTGVWQRNHVHGDGGEDFCQAQSFVSTTASLWSFFWTAFLAIFLYVTIVKKLRDKAERLHKAFHFIAWGIPLVLVGTALGLGKLGNHRDFIPAYTSGWCWIDFRAKDRLSWMLLTGKAWEITAYILCFVFYFMLKCHIREQVLNHKRQFPSQTSRNIALKAQKRLTLVPIIFVLVRIWGTVRFILYTSLHGCPLLDDTDSWLAKGLLYLQGIGDNIQGFTNFLLFCVFTEKFQTRLHVSAQNLVVKCKGICCQPTKVKTVRFQDEVLICSGQETPLIDRSSMTESSHKGYEACQ